MLFAKIQKFPSCLSRCRLCEVLALLFVRRSQKGVDVGAKHVIYDHMTSVTQETKGETARVEGGGRASGIESEFVFSSVIRFRRPKNCLTWASANNLKWHLKGTQSRSSEGARPSPALPDAPHLIIC